MSTKAKTGLTHIEKQKLERELGMESGYVLSFSNRTFEDFFREVVGINISDAHFCLGSGSKANRMRAFWQIASDDQLRLLFRGLLEAWSIHASVEIHDSAQTLLQQLLAKYEYSSVDEPVPLRQSHGKSMYHFLVASIANAWEDGSRDMDSSRCLKVSEFTLPRLINEFGALSPDQVALLTQVPALFAYETPVDQDARVGVINKITACQGVTRIEFELLDSYPPISNQTLYDLRSSLGIDDFEFYRGHWSLKSHDLSIVLQRSGFPKIPISSQPLVNIRKHVFATSLSFPGESRDYVESVANHLVALLGQNSVFYDNFYKSQLAVPNLDTALQELYRSRSGLIVVFLSREYATKMWCGIEFRAIREIINLRQESVMFVRLDDARVEGVFAHDGYIDATTHSALEVATMIRERVLLHTLPKQ